MGRFHMSHILVSALLLLGLCLTATAQLRPNYYAKTCPRVEQIVRQAVQKKIQQTFVTIPATLRLFFHDCFVNGCDASVMIQSTGSNTAEKDHPDNLSLAGDGFDTVIKAKEALDAVPGCKNNVSCADILAIATRDVANLAGALFWQVELGRLDGLVSTASSVNGKLPQASDNVDRLNKLFAANGLTQNEMVALSGAHSVGFSHCNKFTNRIYGFSPSNPVDPTLDPKYANQLMGMCPKNVDPRIAVNMDPFTPTKFDNIYFQNLIAGKGLFTSDQVLYTDARTQPLVNNWAKDAMGFKNSFSQAMIKLGRVGVKTGKNGNIRVRCDAFNSYSRAPPPYHHSSAPPSSGTGIRVQIKPEYRITPPPQLLPHMGDIPHSTFQFDFEFERKILAEADKDSPNWSRFASENVPSRAPESMSPMTPAVDPVVNKYIASGLNREAVPLAVANFGDNPSKVREFVNAFTLLREMGFPSNSVGEALLMFDNDTDKALAHFLNSSS